MAPFRARCFEERRDAARRTFVVLAFAFARSPEPVLSATPAVPSPPARRSGRWIRLATWAYVAAVLAACAGFVALGAKGLC